jgi:uncharacterized protein YkwD
MIAIFALSYYNKGEIKRIETTGLTNSITKNKEKQETPTTNSILLKLHNEQRELKGRLGLKLDKGLIEYAENYAGVMANRNRMVHSDISVLTNRYSFVGENIAWNQKDEYEVTKAWMNSKGHRENILNRNFTLVGFGVKYNRNNEPYWCTNFGN